ncbi:zinc-ribbon domain-containing protein [Desulfosudis oleivorans]|uniref:Response regulator receiver protein n=1 Tax=Desulfosudis oleivorans (strain DSM 6200 / JCM 39069 / Hxd3) TaxID=96561 RepID=A8ZZI2_DESOH|nr:zinc-ribbon domain-containing protein [Desulfosudis oleivorans]ABW68854.1 response regulator receiver protein [Desulfosudis oleivorans Hxd3]
MEIQCDQCGGKFKIADEKVPVGKTVSLSCPTCKNRLSITAPDPNAPPPEEKASAGAFGFTEMTDDSSSYDASDKPFDFIEEEGETALICETDTQIKEPIKKVLSFMEYHISDATDIRDALKKMRYHLFDIIVINETFGARNPDANNLLIYLERLKMKVRREIFVVMLSKRFKTMDHMTEFKKSVNMIVNVNDAKHFEKILNRGLSEYHQFYHIYKEMVRNISTI